MHIAFVDSNHSALEAIGRAKDEGHVVSFIESVHPHYPRTAEVRDLIARADWTMHGVPTTDAGAVTAALAQCHAWHPIDFAVAQFELAVEAVAFACKTLGLRGTNPDAALTARRKNLVRAVLRDAGVATPDFAMALDIDEALAAADAIGYPVVIKPPSGADSMLAYVATNRAEVSSACTHVLGDLITIPPLWHPQFSRGVLLERHLTGPLVSVEIGMRDGRGYPFCITGRTRAEEDEVVELGCCVPAGLSADQELACADYAAAVCRAIGLDVGVFHLEMIVTSSGPVLVEANPRIMGGIIPQVYQYASGRSIYSDFVQIISGRHVDPGPPIRGDCVMSRRFIARTDGQVPADLDTSWLADFQAELLQFDDHAALGLRLPVLRVRQGDLLGRVVVHGPDYSTATRTCGDITARMEKAVGIELMRGEHDLMHATTPAARVAPVGG